MLFIGRVVNALGQPIDEKGPVITTKARPIERVAPGVITRKIRWCTSLQTGIKALMLWYLFVEVKRQRVRARFHN